MDTYKRYFLIENETLIVDDTDDDNEMQSWLSEDGHKVYDREACMMYGEEE